MYFYEQKSRNKYVLLIFTCWGPHIFAFLKWYVQWYVGLVQLLCCTNYFLLGAVVSCF